MNLATLNHEAARLAHEIAERDAREPEQSPQTKAAIGRLMAIRYRIKQESKP